MKVLFVGQFWFGSCARSFKEAMARQSSVDMDDLAEDAFIPTHSRRSLRVIGRVLAAAYRRELEEEIFRKISIHRPDVFMTYKGFHLHRGLIERIRRAGIFTVNVYPDCSPHAHGAAHRSAVGSYDLVVSTKPFHPARWASVYGYRNQCEFVPQGYDPLLHLVDTAPVQFDYDVGAVASWRPEYGDLFRGLARHLAGSRLRVGVAGWGWAEHAADFPPDWVFHGGLTGRSYVEWLRRTKVCIAPLTRIMRVGGTTQPGDVDTTRTYELAAANCFFIHRRTPYVQTVYDEATEVPMFEDAEELSAKVWYFLGHDEERRKIAAAAHRRAVPAYSIDRRAQDVLDIITRRLAIKRPGPA